ncbi:hypothetical protein B6U96_13370 [Archaeoglobales archaeon ex4484_92]|nr:MAG: hypothetical protein B6U96_13370 [Archaeoglobales archaeon ex4484_92]
MEIEIEYFDLLVHYEYINPKELVTDKRARWKCMYGCENYGKKSCPPNVPEPGECIKFLKSYEKGLLFKFIVRNLNELKRVQTYLLNIEEKIKTPYALAIFPGSCVLCNEPCRMNCKLGRPSLSALCIDARQFKLKENEMIGLILID